MTNVPFTKMHGAGNDFILINDCEHTFPSHNHVLIASLAAHRTGVGCEGVILVQRARTADFKMRFFNPDGTEADLCGNGARCVAAFAYEKGLVNHRAMTFETLSGTVDAEVLDQNLVKVWFPEPKERRYHLTVEGLCAHYLVAGVPHVIVPCEHVAQIDVLKQGRAVRLASAFEPHGTNVDFVQFSPPHRALMRTYERGVEAESGACGTGAVATAVVGVETLNMSLPMQIRTSLGYELVVDGDWRHAKLTGLTLTGPVQKVFEGVIDLDALDLSNELD